MVDEQSSNDTRRDGQPLPLLAGPSLDGAAFDAMDGLSPEQLLGWAIESFRDRFVVCTSFQAEGMVVLDMAQKIDPGLRVVTLDTGRLPPESYEHIERVREHYGIEVEIVHPDARQLAEMVRRSGPNLFYKSRELRLECCRLRKVEPLRRALRGAAAWTTGLRRSQSPSRAGIGKVEIDRAHGGILKLSPLADWTSERVWSYCEEHRVPQHPLYDRGYRSIGCAPCTRPVGPREHERAGRWWWEESEHKECGLHWAPPSEASLAVEGSR